MGEALKYFDACFNNHPLLELQLSSKFVANGVWNGMSFSEIKRKRLEGTGWKEQVGRVVGARVRVGMLRGGWGGPSLENKSSKWPTFPNLKVSEIQSFKFSKLQGFEISKCRSFKAAKFHNFELSTIIF